MDLGEKLCLACGLCCDGTLFGHVRLGPGDNAPQLKSLGLPVHTSRSLTPVLRLRQPCTALCADRTCRIYAHRPTQCRAYECGVFQQLRAGQMDFPAALRRVKQARLRANRARQLLRALGDTDDERSIEERFRSAQKRMESGGASAAESELFAELTQAMHSLGLIAQDAFYTRPDSGPQ